jgi:lambda family phage portal protein
MGILNRNTERNLIRDEIALKRDEIALKKEMVETRMGMVRRFRNSGYGQSGASTQKKSLKGWDSTSKSPQEDIDPYLPKLRERSRSLYTSSPLAVSSIKTKKTNVVGSGLQLKSRIDFELLGISREEAARREKIIEREFSIFANSRFCDALRLNNFYELQPLAFSSWMINGDGFSLIRMDQPTKWMPYGLRLYLIEADRVSTPNSTYRRLASWVSGFYDCVGKNPVNGNTIYNGVEIDKNGAVVAYWICNQYPNSLIKGIIKKWERVEAFGPLTGNPNILHLIEQERCEQYRGVPFLAPVIECLKQITRYTEAELNAAVIQAYFTAFITTEAPTNEISFGNTIGGDIVGEDNVADPSEEDVSYELGSGTVNMLRPGEKIEFADPKRPASGFEQFINSMAKMVGAALEIPYELLMKSFTASYSASRAALLEAWKSIYTCRAWFVNDFCQPVYELWLSEAVARGRIDAPGFFNDPAIKAAWCKSEWTGPTMGQIDPVKEVTASLLRMSEALSTHEKETVAMNGGNWDDNIQQVAIERKLLIAAGLGSGTAVSKSTKESNEDDGSQQQIDNQSINNIVNTIVKNTVERSLVESD